MKRRFLAFALTLAMVFSLLPVLPVLTVSAETLFDLSQPNYNNPSTKDTTPVQFSTTSTTATLSANMVQDAGNFTSVDYLDAFTNETNLDEHVTQTILIESMPIYDQPNFTQMFTASGYYNTLTRNYGTATVGADSTLQDYMMYSIYCKDEDGNLGMQVYNPSMGVEGTQEVTLFAEKLNEAFTLTTVWHENSTVSFYCDGEFLGTFENVAYASTKKGIRREYLSVGYCSGYAADDTYGEGTVNLTVSNVEITHGHTVPADDGNCTTAVTCSDCGMVMTPAKDAHIYDHKIAAEVYKKESGVYYLSCSCGTSSAGTPEEATFTCHNLQSPTYSNAAVNFSAEGAAVTFNTDNVYSATLEGNLSTLNSKGAQGNFASLDYTGLFASTTRLDEHVTQTILIENMPIFKPDKAAYVSYYAASGYYNTLTRNYQAATADTLQPNKTAAECHDSILYGIFRKDEAGNLGMEIYNVAAGQQITVEGFAETLNEPFTLTTVWHANNTVTFICDGENLGTFENVTYGANASGSRKQYLSIGYSSGYAYADSYGEGAVNLTVSNVQIAHAHEGGTATCQEQAKCAACGTAYGELGDHAGGTATCQEQAKCDTCGEAYGELAYHVGGTATCTTKPTCDVCGEAYGIYADHTPNAEGNCSVCGAATGYMDLEVENRVTKGKNSTALMTLSKFGAAINAASVTLRTTAGSDYSAVLKSAFIVPDVAQHISQTINITAMPVFDAATHVNGYTGSGYYNNLRRNQRTELVEEEETAVVDYAMYSIYPDASGNLMLGVYSSSGWVYESLNRELGDTFRIDTVWHVDGSLSIYCDGYLVITVAEATTYGVGTQGDHYAAFTMGYSSYGANEAAYGTGAVNMSVSNIVISNGHVEADDGDCTTATVCSVCGVAMNEGQPDHVQPEDDGNCKTPVICSNPGCEYVFVEGHALTHVPEVPATNEATGTKEHWKCETEGCEYFGDLYLDEAGTRKVSEGDLVISKNYEISNDGEKATVSDNYVNEAINGAGEGDVALNVPTTEIEIPAASMNALNGIDKNLIITTSQGTITLDSAFIEAIKKSDVEGALSINVKAGVSLTEVQNNKLAEEGRVEKAISAEMFFAGADIHELPGGTVTIQIDFVTDPNLDENKYELWYVDDNGVGTEQIAATFADGKMTATLTHFSDYAIVYTGELPQEPVEGNTTIETNGGSSFATVTGTYVDGLASGDVFSVNVDWEGLSFNYMAADTWDPETHTNTGGGWEENVTGSVTVTNHSNIAVTVTVTKEDIGTEKGLGVNFVGASTDNLDAGTPENVGAADYCVVEFAPKGTLVEGDTDVTLATITVTITKYDPQN